MELRHLRYFCAVADHGTFSKASRELHVSQSAISEQIADLEREIGGALLDRRQHKIHLNSHGHLFLVEARKTLIAAERALDITRRSLQGQIGTLAIGFFIWGAADFFSRIIREYRKLHPNIRLSLYEMHTNVQMEALTSGKIDVGFTRPLEPPFDTTLCAELLYRDPVVVALPREHPLAGKPIRVASLATERFIMCERKVTPALFDNILALCSAAGFSPEIAHTSTTWSSVLTLVESGEGIAFVPSGTRYLATPGIVFCELELQNASVGISVAWNPRFEGPVLMDFLQLVRDITRGILEGCQ
ncbi:LysR family transcriptional regulator [Granulicella arctica]|uniref:DNA-binding transcriptional LysR family regulator n=1 Tax=Granulicella arctica TaxID=940613 RepID=A0A7Y9PE04_9BACT|nr:LysR family transcriptional regulator [Granulicella arctica]NYF78187.1 DNA-binding transcriptional LysR family regulator [Granulicella arctica]